MYNNSFLCETSSPKIADRVSSHLLDHFPDTVDSFLSSLACVLLRRFWSSLFVVRRSFPDEIAGKLETCRKSTELAPSILQAISAMARTDLHTNSSVQNGTRHKGPRASRVRLAIDTEPFKKLGIDIPTTPGSVKQCAINILQDQQRILKVISNLLLVFYSNKFYIQYYLSIICRPSLSYIFKAEYIPSDDSVSKTIVALDNSQPETTSNATDIKPQSAFPVVQPMKASLYPDSTVGFGNWQILLSTRANQNLREARRMDAKRFKIIIKKIKFVTQQPSWANAYQLDRELSNGHFSDDNQKRLNRANVNVPVYKAKMTRDQCLVVGCCFSLRHECRSIEIDNLQYQVDCIPDYNSNVS
jgi:hypothetical protein